MKLDSRIILQTDILTCFDIERARQFIGKMGYFTDCFNLFENVTTLKYGVLENVSDDDCPFKSYNWWRFFIPESSLKPAEKKLRPYTKEEFLKKFDMGSPIRYRRKDDPKSERRSIFIGYYVYAVDRSDDDLLYEEKIVIGLCDYTLDGLLNYYTLDSLFNDYEFFSYVSVKWCPFGI